MHGALPQAFLHLRALADIEDRLVDGTVQAMYVSASIIYYYTLF
jgi:hypothetical protein